MNTQMTVPELVREMRGRLGLTQEKLAARLGVTFPTINRWENGRTKPSPMAVQHISTMLDEMGDDGFDLLEQLHANRL